MPSPVADFGTLEIHNSCCLGGIVPKILWVTIWVSPCRVQIGRQSVPKQKFGKLPKLAMHSYAWDEYAFCVASVL